MEPDTPKELLWPPRPASVDSRLAGERHVIAAESGGGRNGDREMKGLIQSVSVDRRARLLRFGALIAAALMLALSFLRQRPSGGVGPDDRACARRLRIACRMGPGGLRAAQGR